jgi:hypothetical protein
MFGCFGDDLSWVMPVLSWEYPLRQTLPGTSTSVYASILAFSCPVFSEHLIAGLHHGMHLVSCAAPLSPVDIQNTVIVLLERFLLQGVPPGWATTACQIGRQLVGLESPYVKAVSNAFEVRRPRLLSELRAKRRLPRVGMQICTRQPVSGGFGTPSCTSLDL